MLFYYAFNYKNGLKLLMQCCFLLPLGVGGQLTIVSQSKLLGSHGWAVSEVQPSSVDTDVLVLLRLTMGYWGMWETERPRIWRA